MRTPHQILTLLIACIFAGPAHADLLVPGETLQIPAVPFPTEGFTGDFLISSFNTDTHTGTLITRVLFHDNFNPFGGAYTFTYQITDYHPVQLDHPGLPTISISGFDSVQLDLRQWFNNGQAGIFKEMRTALSALAETGPGADEAVRASSN